MFLRVRDVKDWYIDYLATLLMNEDAEDLTAPFMVIASVNLSEFKPHKTSSYTYEVYIHSLYVHVADSWISHALQCAIYMYCTYSCVWC